MSIDGIIETEEDTPLFPMENKGLFSSKKGWAWLLAPASTALASPWVLLGLGIFVLVIVLLFLITLGKLLGALVLAGGVVLLFRARWWIALLVIGLGVMLFYNPYNLIPGLQMMW